MSLISQFSALPKESKQALFLLRSTNGPFDSTAGLNGFKKDDLKDLRLLLKEIADFAPFVTQKNPGQIATEEGGEVQQNVDQKDDCKEVYNTKEFKYENDFDFNGVMYWLGTNKGQSTNWQNPNDLKVVTVKASSKLDGGGSESTMVGRSYVACYTLNEPMSWMTIDFGNVEIRPNNYSLRHGYTVNDAYLTNWRLEGQEKNKNEWKIIRRHRNETTLKCNERTATWKLDSKVFYSKFRVIQYGGNSRPDNVCCVLYLLCHLCHL